MKSTGYKIKQFQGTCGKNQVRWNVLRNICSFSIEIKVKRKAELSHGCILIGYITSMVPPDERSEETNDNARVLIIDAGYLVSQMVSKKPPIAE